MSIKMGKDSCPYCGKTLDAATPAFDDSAKPKPGDISICIGCGGSLVFANDMSLREMTQRERERLPEDIKKQFATLRLAYAKTIIQSN